MAAISSNADGKWIADAATTWVGGVAPTEGDTATILNTHDVEIDGDITVGADTTTAAIQVNSGGSLFVPSTVAGDYTLILKGDLKTDATGGTISFGTAANPIPNTRIFTVKTNYSASLADGKYGIIIAAGGTFNCQGADRWGSGLSDPDRCLLAADAAVNATSLTASGSTLWKNNDVIAIGSTSRTYTECEVGTLNGDASGTTLTVDGFGGVAGGLAYAHSGTSPTQAEIINLTRNVIIQNYDGALGVPGNVGYVVFATTSTIDIDWTSFRYLGQDASNKQGITINNTSGTVNINRCSLYDFEDFGIVVQGNSTNKVTISNNVTYNLGAVTGYHLYLFAGGLTGITINNNWMMFIASNNILFYDQFGVMSASDNHVIGSRGVGIEMGIYNSVLGGTTVIHSGNTTGLRFMNYLNSGYPGDIVNHGTIKSWRNNAEGIQIRNTGYIEIASIEVFGNNTNNIYVVSAMVDVIIDNLISNGDTTFSTTNGIYLAPTYYMDMIINTGDFSTVAGIKTAHTNDFNFALGTSCKCEIYLSNIKLGGTNPVVGFNRAGYVTTNSFISIRGLGQDSSLAGRKYIDINGTMLVDTSYYKTASPSAKMTPAYASYKLDSGIMRIPVASGANPTVSVYFRKSASYNGSQPRLIVKRNDPLGITADTVMATSAAAVDVDVAPGTFTQLSGQPGAVSADGVLEVYVDCDGTAGYINICDWAVTGAKTQADNLDAYYSWGLPFNGLLSAAAGGGGGGPIFKSGGIFN